MEEETKIEGGQFNAVEALLCEMLVIYHSE